MSFAKREMDDQLTTEDVDPVDRAIGEAIIEALAAPVEQRTTALVAISRGLCRAHMRRDPDLPCLCDKPGRLCHASLIYRNEAVSIMLSLEAAGFEIKRL